MTSVKNIFRQYIKGGRNLGSDNIFIDYLLMVKLLQNVNIVDISKGVRIKVHIYNCVKEPSSQCVEEAFSCSKSEDINYGKLPYFNE